MTAQSSGQATDGVRRAPYTNCSMEEILNDIGPVIYGTVFDDAADNKEVDKNHHGLQIICGLRYGDGPTQTHCRKVFPKRTNGRRPTVSGWNNKHLRIDANNASQYPLHMERRIAGRAIHFHTTETMKQFKCTSGITIDKKWIVVERSEALCSCAMSDSFPLRQLVQVIPCNFSPP